MESWAAFYKSDLQGVYALAVLPISFLVYRAVVSPRPENSADPTVARFVNLYTLVFAVETLIDPIATGPMLKALGWGDNSAGTVVSFLFVYLGDFRVLALIFGVALASGGLPRALGTAARWSLIVPVVAGGSYAALSAAFPEMSGQVLWLIYELGFLTLAIYLSRRWIEVNSADLTAPSVAFLRDAAGFAAVYYALWACADLLITYGGLDAGWAIRIVPNQLYYAVWIPFVYFRFFGFGGQR